MKTSVGGRFHVFKILCANEWLSLSRTLCISFREKILYGYKNKIIAKSRVSVLIINKYVTIFIPNIKML